MGIVGSEVLSDICGHIDGSVLFDKSYIGCLVQMYMSWGRNRSIDGGVHCRVSSGICRNIFTSSLVALFVQELLEIGISFISNHILSFNRGSCHSTIIRNVLRYIGCLVRRDVSSLCGINCLIGGDVSRNIVCSLDSGVFSKVCLGSDISLHSHGGILSSIGSHVCCDVGFLGCISGLIGSDIGRYVGGSIRCNINLDRSSNILCGRSIFGLVSLNLSISDNNCDGIVLHSL